jgi:hypothetical protein
MRSSCKNAQLLKADMEIITGTAIQWTAHSAEVHMPVLSSRYCLGIIESRFVPVTLFYVDIELNIEICFTCC